MKKIFLASSLVALTLAGCQPYTAPIPPAAPANTNVGAAIDNKNEGAMKKDDLDAAGADLNSAQTEGLDADVNAMEKDL